MSSLIRNNRQFLKLYRLRISQKASLYRFHNNLHLNKPSRNLLSSRKSFATAALNIKTDYENGKVIKNEENIDNALREIDFSVRRTGRTVLESVNDIFQIIENNGYATESQSVYLLRCCSFLHLETPTKRVELANKMWNKFKALGIPLNTKHFNALLKVYLTSEEKFLPSDFLVLMDQHSVKPNQVTYAYMIEKYCQEGNLTGANEVLEFMKERGLPVNEAVFNSLIKGHVKNDDFSGAKDIMEVMRNSSIAPSSLSYAILACRYAEKGNIDKVEEIISEAENCGILLKNTDYLEIILLMAALKETEYIDKLLNRMENIYEWRQDIINTAAELIHVGADKLAHKLIMAISSSEYYLATNIFLRTLIKNKIPLERVVEYSTEIYENGINPYIFTNAARVCMDNENLDYALAFFNEMHKRGIPVRLRNFRPFFTTYKSSPEGIWKIIKNLSQFGLPLDNLTLEEYIIPAISGEPIEKIVSNMQEYGQSLPCALKALVKHYCSVGDIERASLLIEEYHVPPLLNFNFKQFLLHYKKFRRNSTTYFKVLKNILENKESEQDFAVLQGRQLALFLQTSPDIFDVFHRSAVGSTCNYHKDSIEVCRRIIRRENPTLLNKLNFFEKDQQNMPTKSITAEDEQKILDSSLEENPRKGSQLIEVLSIHLKNQDIERSEKVLKELDNLNYTLPPAVFMLVFSLQCEMNSLDAAQKSYHQIKELYPSFKIDSSKIFNYARLLLKFSKTDECIDLIKSDCQEINVFYGNDLLIRSLRRFLNNIVQTGDVDLAKSIQNNLINHIESSELKETVLEPVLKIYLHRDDLEASLKEANDCVMNYKCFPCQGFLMLKLVKENDHSKLQSVINLASKLETESKVLLKLALLCIEVNRFQQAAKILQNLGPNINFNYLEEKAKEYYEKNQVTFLESLLYATSCLKQDKQEVLFNLLLKLLDKRNDFKKCVKVMDFVKSENIIPCSNSKTIINNIFKKNGQSAPFEDVSEDTDSNVAHNLAFNTEELSIFRNNLNQKNAMEALKELEKLKKGHIRIIPLNEMTELIELLLEKKCLNAIDSNVHAMSFIIENARYVFKPLFEKFSERGDVQAMVNVANVFPDFSMKRSNFNSYLSKAYIASDRHEDLLALLESSADKRNKFFSISAFEELLKIPQLEKRIIDLSKRYLEKNFSLPLAVIWSHYFVSERYEKAKEISQIATIPVEKFDNAILRSIQQTENFEMGKKYIEFLSQLSAKDRNIERAYGTLLDLYVLKGMQNEAVDLVMEAKSKDVNLHKYCLSTLSTLKSSLERENKSVPFTVEEATC